MSVRKIKLKDGDGWIAQVNVAGMARKTRNFRDKDIAQKFHDATEQKMIKEAKARDQMAIREARSRPSISRLEDEMLLDVLKAFDEAGKVADIAQGDSSAPGSKVGSLKRKGKRRRLRPCTKRQRKTLPTILKHVKNTRISDIDEDWTDEYILKLRCSTTRVGRQFAWGTIAEHLKILSVACRWRASKLKQACPDLPFSTMFIEADWDNRRTRRLEYGEQRVLMQRLREIKSVSKSHWVLLVRLALDTGARLQELVLSEWPEFRTTDRGMVWDIPGIHVKTGASRSVPLSKAAQRHVRALRLLSIHTDKRVFHLLGGPTSVSAGFHKYVVSAGLEDLRFHDLRHEATTRFMDQKRKMREMNIMMMVGHSSLNETARYLHIRTDEMCELMD